MQEVGSRVKQEIKIYRVSIQFIETMNGPHAQNMNTFIGSIVNLIERNYMTIQGV